MLLLCPFSLLAIGVANGSVELIGWIVEMIVFSIFLGIVSLALFKNKLAAFVCFSTLFAAVGIYKAWPRIHGQRDAAKKTGELVKEAAGTKPVESAKDPEEEKVSTFLREWYRYKLDYMKKHHDAVQRFDADMANLYQANSFASRAEMMRSIAAINSIRVLDRELFEKYRQDPQEFATRLNASDLEPAQKQKMASGFSRSENANLFQIQKQIDSIEDEWVSSTVGLYRYAIQHSENVHVTGDRIGVDDEEISVQFNSKLTKCLELLAQITTANTKAETLQKASMQQFGIDKTDLGLK